MKIIFFVFFIHSLQAAADTKACFSSDFHFFGIEEMQNLGCELTNKINACTGETQDKKSRSESKKKQYLAKSLDILHKVNRDPSKSVLTRQHSAQVDIASAYGKEAPISFFRFSRYIPEAKNIMNKKEKEFFDLGHYEQIPKGERVRIISSIDTFLNESQSSEHFKKLRDKIVDKTIQFENDFQCTASVFSKDVNIVYPDECFDSREEAAQGLLTLKGEVDSFYKNYMGEEAIHNNISCSEKNSIQTQDFVIEHEKACSANFEHFFGNNEWKITDLEKIKSNENYLKFNACLEEAKKNGLELNRVSINSSSSQLNNTSIAAKMFCKKGFRELSLARAEEAKNVLLKDLNLSETTKVEINAEGENGNGSSGDCPYEIVDGKEVLKKGYEYGGEKRKDLESAKYVKVKVSFKPKATVNVEPKKCFRINRSCQTLRFKCSDWSDQNFQPGFLKD